MERISHTAALHARTAPLFRQLPAPGRTRAIKDGLVLGSAILSVGILFGLRSKWDTFGWDSYAYWLADPMDPYRGWNDLVGSFRYSPAAAQVMAIFHFLPWDVFRVAWAVTLGLVAARLAGWWVLLLPWVVLDLFVGNVHILLAAAIVLGFRHPVTWSFVLLTKVTPGIGLLWFAVRREWRHLGLALGATAIIVLASAALAPGLWSDWLYHLADDGRPLAWGLGVPLGLRIPAAALLVSWGALTDRRWTVPVAAFLALPVLWPSIGPALLIAVVPLMAAGRSPRNVVTRPGWPEGTAAQLEAVA